MEMFYLLISLYSTFVNFRDPSPLAGRRARAGRPLLHARIMRASRLHAWSQIASSTHSYSRIHEPAALFFFARLRCVVPAPVDRTARATTASRRCVVQPREAPIRCACPCDTAGDLNGQAWDRPIEAARAHSPPFSMTGQFSTSTHAASPPKALTAIQPHHSNADQGGAAMTGRALARRTGCSARRKSLSSETGAPVVQRRDRYALRLTCAIYAVQTRSAPSARAPGPVVPL